MVLSMPSLLNSTTARASPSPLTPHYSFFFKRRPPSSLPLFLPSISRTTTLPLSLSRASKSQTGPVKRRSSSTTPSKKRKKKDKGDDSQGFSLSDVEIVHHYDADADDAGPSDFGPSSHDLSYHPTTLPKPPAGFVVDDHGKVLMVSTKRIATIAYDANFRAPKVDPINNFPLECIIRRVFRSSRGHDCMLLCPVDTPVQILKSTNVDGWSAVSDEEVESVLPSAAYALAKIHMHLVHSGFCYTARGGFCYSEDDIFDFRTDDGQDVDGLPTEGVEITCFNLAGAHYMIYTPSDPLLFVAVKDNNGVLHIVDDDVLEDPAIISAIDEETEFNALVEEEAALLKSLLGKE